MREYQISITMCRPRKNHIITTRAESESSVYEALCAATHELLSKIEAGGKRLPECGHRESWEGSLKDHEAMKAWVEKFKGEADDGH